MAARFIRFENALIPVEKIEFVKFSELDLEVEIHVGRSVIRFACDGELYQDLIEFLTDGTWPFDITTIWTKGSSTSH